MVTSSRQREQHDRNTSTSAAWLALWRWSWTLPVCLAFFGILLGTLTNDHRLASRSASVLLVACALIVVQEWLR